MSESNILEQERATFFEDDTTEIPPADIVAYNELRSCADLFRMHLDGTLEIQPEFQREIVWSPSEQTRFVDSLIKKLPIPSMCISLDSKTEKMQVIDGLQRVATIIQFLSGKNYKGEDWTLSTLEDIDERISGRPLAEFLKKNSKLNALYRRVENLTIPITIIRCDYSKRIHTEFLFTIFHRLNSGGSRLNNQEIRNCIFFGRFNDMLHELNREPIWLKINRIDTPYGHRFRYQEIILRMLAFQDQYEQYGGRLAKFLNDYMDTHKAEKSDWLKAKKSIFLETISIIDQKLFALEFDERPSLTILEAILVGISRNLKTAHKNDEKQLMEKYQQLLKHDEFSDAKLREGLSGKPRVIGRLSAAEKIFSG